MFRSLYLDQDLDYCKKNIEEAEEFNCLAISITVDAPVRPVSYNKTDTGYDARKHYRKMNLKMPRQYFRKRSTPLTWKNIEFIRNLTKKNYLIRPGLISAFFLIFYSIFRFIVEFFRVPDEQLGFLYLNLTMGQIISLIFIVFGFYLYSIKKNEN